MESRNNSKTKMLAEAGVLLALAVLLSYIILFQAPNGGNVTAGSMIPIMFFAYRWGLGPGILLGVSFGLMDFFLRPFFFHPIQFLFDYPLAYASLGLIGLAIFREREGSFFFYLGPVIAILGRLIFHTLSGVIFFSEAAGLENPWIFSIGYNTSYLIPELIMTLVVFFILKDPLKNILRR